MWFISYWHSSLLWITYHEITITISSTYTPFNPSPNKPWNRTFTNTTLDVLKRTPLMVKSNHPGHYCLSNLFLNKFDNIVSTNYYIKPLTKSMITWKFIQQRLWFFSRVNFVYCLNGVNSQIFSCPSFQATVIFYGNIFSPCLLFSNANYLVNLLVLLLV